MPESTKISDRQPRVFLSYARADGQDFAKELRTRLDGEQIPLWQDRVSLEGGRDWWLQIVEALDQVEFMVLVMTPAALQSPIVQKEWRTARQKGVCVYPVKGSFPIDFASLPRWMRDVHWYDLDYEWIKLVNDLQTRCEQPAVPFMVEELPEDFVERPQEFEALIGFLLDTQREEPIAITAALRGAGGYGKTTLARALCHDARIQEAFDDGILWVTLGEHPESLIGKVEDLIYMLSHERPDFTGMDAAVARLAELLADRDILLVIDDVWNSAHLKPFLHGGDRCARLITTRDDGVLPRVAQRIVVDTMQQDQAVRLLSAGLPIALPAMDETKTLRQLVTRLGEWPLLLKLVNSALRERVDLGQDLADALKTIHKTLEKRGLTAFDAQNAEDRNQAVTKTLGVSFDLLSANDHLRYRELAIFPEDIDIPLATVKRLWGATGGLDELDTEDVCARLHRFSLLLRYDLATRTIRLHDVIRSYLQQDVGAIGLMSLHAQFLQAYEYSRWADLPPDEPYLWDHLAEHLLGAGRGEDLIATVKDGRYLTVKTHLRSVYVVEADVSRALEQAPTDSALLLLQRSLGQMSHLLTQCTTQREVAAVLHTGLSPLRELSAICATLEQEHSRPLLTSWHALPQLRNVQLLLTLRGHTDGVRGCAVSPGGEYIVSASDDDTLKVWDAHTGACHDTLLAGGPLYGCACCPDNIHIIAVGSEGVYFLRLLL
jgi:hypothetical protein